MESHESDTKIVKTYWIEQAADSVTNAIHDFNRFAASGYSHEELRKQYLEISSRIKYLKDCLDEIPPKCEATLYDALFNEEFGSIAATSPKT